MRSAAAPERLQFLKNEHRCRRETTHADLELRIVRRHLRTLCEDLDQVLGRVGDAVRRHHVKVAARLLDDAVAIAAELARQLPPVEGGQDVLPTPVVVDTLDEVKVQRSLGLLEELDAELDRTARGGAAVEAPGLAHRLGAEIVALAAAAASGQVRARAFHRRDERPSMSTVELALVDLGNPAPPLGEAVPRALLMSSRHPPVLERSMTTERSLPARLDRAVNFTPRRAPR